MNSSGAMSFRSNINEPLRPKTIRKLENVLGCLHPSRITSLNLNQWLRQKDSRNYKIFDMTFTWLSVKNLATLAESLLGCRASVQTGTLRDAMLDALLQGNPVLVPYP